MKIYVVGGANHYTNFLNSVEPAYTVEEADIVFFTGGEDVDPSLYGCNRHFSTFSNIERDLEEKEIFEKVTPDQICVGCCRGSQFLCVMNGGFLVQDVSGHALGRTHGITNGTTIYQITSTHHQMQYPYNLSSLDFDLLYWSARNRSDYYSGDKIKGNLITMNGEPEIVLYHKEGLPKCLAIQGHPEMIPFSPVSTMIRGLIEDLVYENRRHNNWC